MDYTTERLLRRAATRQRETDDRMEHVERRDTGNARVEASLVRITGLHADSPATGVRMYLGDVYGNGSASAATATGVTVRIPDIAADVTAPSYGVWSDLPPLCGVKTRETWTGATATHTSDIVYNVPFPVLA